VTILNFFSSAASSRGNEVAAGAPREISGRALRFQTVPSRLRRDKPEHPAIKTKMDGCAERVFDFQHFLSVQLLPHRA